ncbi:MAG: DNA-processing protein DprA [Candidatus Zixiibacteriota bacterium]
MISSETKERLVDTITLLSIPGVGRGRFARLVGRFGSATQALGAPYNELVQVPGLSDITATAIREKQDGETARQMAARIAQHGWSVLFPDSPEYPSLLAHIDDRPPLLFRLGEECTPSDKHVGIVGTRHATEWGRRFTHQLAAELAGLGITVVSGMAEGIDSAAHRGALDSGGKTVAIWGTPLDLVYPPSNRELAERIKNHGAIYSEYWPGMVANPSNFPERNRIISGMSEGVIVVEAGVKSGALITAQFALEQGRELFAVPGRPGSDKSTGTNALIKQGARLLLSARDVLEEIPRLAGDLNAKKVKQKPDLTDIELKMVDHLAAGPVQIDQLCRLAGMPVSEVMEYLLALELKGVVQELPGKRFVLTDQ